MFPLRFLPGLVNSQCEEVIVFLIIFSNFSSQFNVHFPLHPDHGISAEKKMKNKEVFES